MRHLLDYLIYSSNDISTFMW